MQRGKNFLPDGSADESPNRCLYSYQQFPGTMDGFRVCKDDSECRNFLLDKSLINSYFTQFCAGGVLVSVPISILFMIMQKFYVEGITGGAVKG